LCVAPRWVCACVCNAALHPPCVVPLTADPRHSDLGPDLPWPRDPVRLEVELGRQAEVPLAPCRKPDVGDAPRHPEGPCRVAVEVVPDDVPDALVEPKRVRVQPPLGL